MKFSVSEAIRSIKPYVPGKPIEELEREYGIKGAVKLASNENPLGPSPLAIDAVTKALAGLNRYPDGGGHELITRLARMHGVAPGNIVLGNGSDDIIGMLALAFLAPGDEAVLPRPSFLMYEIAVKSADAVPVYAPLNSSLAIDLEEIRRKITPSTKMVFLCNPNNPTGTIIADAQMNEFLKGIPDHIIVVVDEAYIEFVRDKNCTSSVRLAGEDSAVVTLRTFSKAYGLAGLRAGYGIMAGPIADILNRVRQPFNLNSPAQAGAAAALADTAFFEKTIRTIHGGLDDLYRGLDRLGIPYFPTQANFFLIDVRTDANEVFKRLLKQGVIVRSMVSYGFPTYIRVNVGLPEENGRLLDALETVVR